MISRRMLLRSAAATIALPLLPSALPARADATEPTRLFFWFNPNGFHMPSWTPGADFALPYLLEPLGAVRQEVMVISGLAQEAGYADRPGDHARGTGSFLTCRPVRFTAGSDIENGVSVDQVAAASAETLFPSLQLGMDLGGSTGDCDSGYSCAYVRNISWAGPATPLPNLVTPQIVFDRLFGGSDASLPAEERARRLALRTSVLDHVVREAQELHGRLGATDRLKLDEYLSAVREVEVRIQTLGASGCGAPEEPGWELAYPERVRAMLELAALAFQCDLTRITTFMLGQGGSNRSYEFLGVTGAHHELSHHQGDPAKHAALEAIGRWEVEQLAWLLGRLRELTAFDGSPLLDHALVFFSSEIADGDSHAHRDLPVLLAGRGGGARPGRHLQVTAPVANLFVSMLGAVGIDTAFGDSTGALDLA